MNSFVPSFKETIRRHKPHQTFSFSRQKTGDCFSFPESTTSYYPGFDVESCDEWLYGFGYDCGGEFGVDSFHKFRIFFLFVSESAGVHIDVFLFGVVEHLVFVDFE